MEERPVITTENVIDMAWKAEGLDRVLEEKGQRVDLRDLRRAYDFVPLSPETPLDGGAVWAFRKMEQLTRSYKHDSGKRKFNSI